MAKLTTNGWPQSEEMAEFYRAIHEDREKSGEIWINGVIDATVVEMTVMRLLKVAMSGKFNRVLLFINSPGGFVDEAFGAIDIIQALPVPVWTINVGTAESMGLSIFLAGERRFALAHSNFMAHSISYYKGDDKIAEQESYLECAKLKQVQHADYYAERTKKTAKWWAAKFKEADFFFDAEQAVKLGVATDVVESPDVFSEIFDGVVKGEES